MTSVSNMGLLFYQIKIAERNQRKTSMSIAILTTSFVQIIMVSFVTNDVLPHGFSKCFFFTLCLLRALFSMLLKKPSLVVSLKTV